MTSGASGEYLGIMLLLDVFVVIQPFDKSAGAFFSAAPCPKRLNPDRAILPVEPDLEVEKAVSFNNKTDRRVGDGHDFF
jgi:hypothetical protein